MGHMDRTKEFRSQKSAAVADPSMMGSYGEPGNPEEHFKLPAVPPWRDYGGWKDGGALRLMHVSACPVGATHRTGVANNSFSPAVAGAGSTLRPLDFLTFTRRLSGGLFLALRLFFELI